MPVAGPDEILVRIEGISTCPQWDLHVMSGEPMFPGRPFVYPYALGQPGHEAVGVVAALGPGVDGPPVGTRVAAWRDQGHDRLPAAMANTMSLRPRICCPYPIICPPRGWRRWNWRCACKWRLINLPN